jgi:hypothetical protein
MKQCREFATDARQPYSNEQVIAKTHAIVFNMGLYHDALEKWDEVPVVQATYDNFCKHMIQAQTRLQNKRTSKHHSYGMAAEHIQELMENFCNLVSSECNDKENDRNLINLMRQEMATMRSLIEQMHTKQVPVPKNRQLKLFTDQGSYCWTHGYAVTKSHNSQNCRTKAPGHKEEATRDNNMGGNQKGKPSA